MKYLIFTMFSLVVVSGVNAQQTSKPVHTQFPLPQFTITQPNNAPFTKNNIPKGKNVLIMLFSPDCDHCKKETETIKTNIDDFKNTHIVMVTSQTMDKMNAFYKQYELDKFKNITMGYDKQFFFPNYFKIKFYPYLAVYDKKFELKKTFEGNAKWEELKPLL